MKLVVYKGFDNDFLKAQKIEPLINNNYEDKCNYLKLDDNYKNQIMMAVLSNINLDKEFFITYEEFELAYDHIILFSAQNSLSIRVINNNIYVGLYPLNISISDELYNKYQENKIDENTRKETDKEVEKINKFYSDIYFDDDKYYVSYYNYEFINPDIEEIDNYFNVIDLSEEEAEYDYLVDIGNDYDRYIEHIKNIKQNNYKKIAFKKLCQTTVSDSILQSLKAYCSYLNIDILFELKKDYTTATPIKEELKNIARTVLKRDDFEFRSIKFYKQPDIDQELEDISQGDIMEYIVEEAEKAYSGKSYRDIFITAPTGAGKSMIFQLPSIYLAKKYKKLIIIIEPLKGLMNNQWDNLKKVGFNNVAYLNSDIATITEREKIVESIKNGEIDLLYVSPETLLSHSYESLIGDREVGLIIVDEAHIVTTWGVGFRPDYWYLGSYINKLRTRQNKFGQSKKYFDFPIFACTATAVNGGIDDSVMETFISLYMRDPIKKIGYTKRNGEDRDISFEINVKGENITYDRYLSEKVDVLGQRINKWIDNKDKTIIYCPYSTIAHQMKGGQGDFRILDVFKEDTGVYTGGNYDVFEKNEYMKKFEDSEINVMYATKAFGMGIDIPDVQNVYHYAVTGGLSDYIQEIGRAARKPGMHGKAIIDYFDGDMKYMNRLFGMSQIRQYHVKKCLSIIYETFKNKGRRNFLINPSMFNGVFGKAASGEENGTTNKLKIVLLMLEKDLYDTYGIYVLISRPGSLFTKGFTCIKREEEQEVLRGKYGKYFKRVAKGRTNDGGFKSYAVTVDPGDVFEIDLKGIWEEFYPDMSFAMFKYYYFNNKRVMTEISGSIMSRVKLTVKPNKGKLNELYAKAHEEIDYITSVLDTFGRKFFTKDEFKMKLNQKYKKMSKSEVIANTYFDIVDPQNNCIKYSRTEESEKYQISNGNIRNLAESVLGRSSMFRRFIHDENEEYMNYVSEQSSKNDIEALKLLSLLDIVTFEVIGGDTPEIFIRLNAPDKIKNIVEDRVIYKNKYVEKAREKHYRNVKIMDYFFRHFDNDTDRWNYIEKYFLGGDVISEIPNYEIESQSSEANYKNVNDFIKEEDAYSLSDYTDWKDVFRFLVREEKYKYYINILNKNNIRIPDYGFTNIKVNDVDVDSMFIYAEKNVLITYEYVPYEVIKICNELGWTVIKIDEVENEIEFLKEM